MRILFLAIFLLLPTWAAVHAESGEEVELERGSQGAVIGKDIFMDIPKDKKVYKVGSNVLKVEDSGKYVARRVDALEENVHALESRIGQMEIRFAELEEKIDQSLK
ncbi:hypothetical protein N9K06_01305 [Omnitrophica bacterium]|nr:hypothetical protein [Candidatus Omnitrophota bacterium]